MKLLVTGGAGFIGSNFVRYWLENHPEDEVFIWDALTYAGHLESLLDVFPDLKEIPKSDWGGVPFLETDKCTFRKGDITDPSFVDHWMEHEPVDVIVHFAAETHVDRSVMDPMIFVKTNVLGTATLLNAALNHKVKRFHHVSTDEVFGSLGLDDPKFNEDTPYEPRTPYSASKAGSDHLVRAYFETYGLPVTITNCANNFGPYHDPEKLIPRFITNLLEGEKVPLMGNGENVRSWLYVKDHAKAIETVLQKGEVGETYCVGGEEKTNLEVTRLLLKMLGKDEGSIEHIEHRLGHDFRYAIDDSKLRKLGWEPEHSFEEWLEKTVEWFKENEWWWKPLREDRPDVDPKAQKGKLNG